MFTQSPKIFIEFVKMILFFYRNIVFNYFRVKEIIFLPHAISINTIIGLVFMFLEMNICITVERELNLYIIMKLHML